MSGGSAPPTADFTSAAYLGFRHRATDLAPWAQLTTGRPAALYEPSITTSLTRSLARLVGLDDAVVSPSTLHAAWDLFGVIALQPSRWVVALDDDAYPIVGWALSRLAGRQVPVVRFTHRQPASLAQRLSRGALLACRPLVVVDGVCAGCGIVPIDELAAVVAARDGLVVVDDTQALGVLGASPDAATPYGEGGGGSVRWHGLDQRAPVVLVSSLAKAFGVPIAVTAGAAPLIDSIRSRGDTRVHCSPPSQAHLHAARHALDRNAADGAEARGRLLRNVRRLRRGVASLGVLSSRDDLPVQPIGPFDPAVAHDVHARLIRHGVLTVVQRPHDADGLLVTFLVRATHQPTQIDRASAATCAAVTATSERRRRAS